MREGDKKNVVAEMAEEEANKPSQEPTTEMSPEKLEEFKLKQKFPQQALKGGQSHFLQKRLQQRKFFDSGDYNMAKAKGLKVLNPLAPKTMAKPPLSVVVDEASDGSTSPTGMEIPTPNTVPQRKTSIVQPTASKLSPQPIHHHSPDTSALTQMETA